MSVESAVLARLKATAAVTNLTTTARIYGMRLPQKPTYPAIRIQKISETRVSLMGADSGVVHTRMQVDSYGETYSSARGLADAVRGALKRFRGTSASVVVQDVTLDNEFAVDEDDVDVYRVQQDYMVHWSE